MWEKYLVNKRKVWRVVLSLQLIVVKKNHSSEVKQRSERIQRFRFNSSELKQRREHSYRSFLVTSAREIIFQWHVLT